MRAADGSPGRDDGAADIFVTGGILRPVRVLDDAAQKIAAGNLKARAEVNSRDEIKTLANSFNDMAEKMQGLIGKIKEDEQRMRWLDLRLLQEQINPHFLYNTLDNIIWLAESKETQQVVSMVSALSDFFGRRSARVRITFPSRTKRRTLTAICKSSNSVIVIFWITKLILMKRLMTVKS